MKRLEPDWAVKMLVVIVFTSMLFRCVSATNHTVGGTSGWELASDIQNWSSGRTFYTGDYLVFMYGPTHDVLEVDGRDFAMCQISNPISTYNDGNSVLPLQTAGTRYFICGTPGHCSLGMRVQVDVFPLPTTRGGTGKKSPPLAKSPPSPPPPRALHKSPPPPPPRPKAHGRSPPPPPPRAPCPSNGTASSGSRVRFASWFYFLLLLWIFSLQCFFNNTKHTSP